MKSASFRLALGFALAMWANPGEAADILVVPTPEQDEHCRLVADGKCPLVYSVRGLTFPEKADELGFFTRTARMGIFKPKGDGPFPAVLVLHACGAVDADPEHMDRWVKQAVGRGYVAFVVDSWGQRGITELCTSGPRNFPPFLSIHLDVRVRDAYEALNHLAKFDFVDRDRVGVVGFSNGARTAYLTVSAQMAKKYARDGARFAAAVGVYGKCSFMQSDVDRPLLALLGELDEDGDPKVCIPRLQQMQSRGVPTDWHVYPKMGHAWDQPKKRPPQKVYYLGQPNGVWFAYDAAVAEDTYNRTFSFFNKYLMR